MLPPGLAPIPWPHEAAEEALAALHAAIVHVDQTLAAHARLVEEHTGDWWGHQATIYRAHARDLARVGAAVLDRCRAQARAVVAAAEAVAAENALRARARARWREAQLAAEGV